GNAPCDPSATTKVFRRHPGNALAHAVVDKHAAQIRELIAAMKRRDSIVDVSNIGHVGDVGDIHDSKALPTTAPPGMEEIAGPDGKPAKGAESKSRAETYASAKSEEGDVCRGPNRPVSGIDRPGPPCP